MITRRATLALAAPALLGISPAWAAEELALVVGAPAGSVSDRWARAFAPFLERHLQRLTVRVRNQPGGNGLDMARRLASAPPDGRLVAAATMPSLPAQALEQGTLSLLDKLDFLAAVLEEPLVIAGGPMAGELGALRQVKEGALGTPPIGSAGHLLALSLKDELPALSVLPFPTGVAARQAAQAGNVAAAVVALADAYQPLRDGKLPGIAMATVQRHGGLPQVPSFTELGLRVPRPIRRGFMLPPGVPDGMRASLVEALKAAAADPEFADQAKASGARPKFLDSASWQGQVRETSAELEARWKAAPWRSADAG